MPSPSSPLFANEPRISHPPPVPRRTSTTPSFRIASPTSHPRSYIHAAIAQKHPVTMQNILESQVTDLANLADSPIQIPIPTPYAMSEVLGGRAAQSQSAESPARDHGSSISNGNGSGGGNGSANKRKSSEALNSGAPQRAKRNRYISIACNECKRRKIKCNGETPCQRCGNLNLECQYAPNCCANGFKDSEEFKQMNAHLSSLQEQVDNLYASLNALRNGDMSGHGSAVMSHRSLGSGSPGVMYKAPPKHQRFRGPTSSAFSFDVAKNTLHNMGYPGLADSTADGVNAQDETPLPSPPLNRAVLPAHPYKDPLMSMSKDEAVRLCIVYEDEMGIMYPYLDIDAVIRVADIYYQFQEANSRNGMPSPEPPEGITEDDINILKMVIAVGLVNEGNGPTESAARFYDNVKHAVDDILHGESVDTKSLPLLVVVAMFHFHCDEEALAWRMIGQASRMCIELGLHRQDSLYKNFPEAEDRAGAVRLFWCIYCLDRRWSFGTGMPFAMQDADIDPTIPEPECKLPYLSVMISYNKIGSRVWRSVAGFEGAPPGDIKKEDIGYLDYQVVQWQKSIPHELQLPTTNSPQPTSRAIHRLQVLLYLRANQMRILIYRPVLHSANSIMENLSYAQTVVDLAKDTIRALTHLNQTTDIYRAQQVCFNYFLISALAVIFLASCHAPVQFSSLCKDEFYMALDLVRGFSSKSYVSKRLWRTIKGLKEIAPRLGLEPESSVPVHSSNGVEDPHSSAALAMAGLAGHEITNIQGFMGERQLGNSPMNGFQMSHEMTNLFEAALGSAAIHGVNGHGSGYAGAPIGDGMVGANMGGAGVFGGEEELYKQLRDLF